MLAPAHVRSLGGTKLDLSMMWMEPARGSAEEMGSLSRRQLKTMGKGVCLSLHPMGDGELSHIPSLELRGR